MVIGMLKKNARPAISNSGMMIWGAPSPSTEKCKAPEVLMSGTSARMARKPSLLPYAEVGRMTLFPNESNGWGLHPACVEAWKILKDLERVWRGVSLDSSYIWGTHGYPGYPTFRTSAGAVVRAHACDRCWVVLSNFSIFMHFQCFPDDHFSCLLSWWRGWGGRITFIGLHSLMLRC